MYNYYYANQPQMVPQMAQPQMAQPQINQPVIQRRFDIVQGKVSAETYPVDAGTELYLLDMDNPYIYRKARGFDNKIEPLETYRLERVDEEHEESVDLSGYITQETLNNVINNEIEKRIKDEVDRRISEISFAPTKKVTRKGDNA